MAPGIDEGRVTDWFDRKVAGVEPPLRFELIAGGRSNLTFRVFDGGGRVWVLRRPPTGHVLPTAHDMAREFRIISAVGPAGVPAPTAVGLCEDAGVTGAPFFVMGLVEGHALRTPDEVEAALTPDARRRASHDMIDVMAALHALDPVAVGLGDLGRREGYVARQLKRWYAQFQASTAETGRSVPAVDDAHAALVADIPEQQGASIVHGDYRLDNAIVADDGTIAALLDWELCTLGDPLADVGLMLVYWSEPGDAFAPLGVAPTTAPGFCSRAELRDRYATASGRDLSAIDYYMAFGYWKLACILEGVYTRYSGGSGAGDQSDIDAYPTQIDDLSRSAREILV